MKYLVTLRPIGSYFFGGEVTLGDGTSQNYFVESSILPQASTLLGLMRYEVLRQNGLLSYDPSDPKVLEQIYKLIGQTGFSLETPVEQYGIIHKISPVFLTDGQQFYTAMPLDEGYTVELNTINRCSYFACDHGSEDQKENITSETTINGFNPKTYDNYKYWCDPAKKRLDNPFTFSQQIGITKNGRKDNEKDAFYKQTLVRLAPSLSMAFTVEVEKGSPFKEGKCILPLGGNRSMFVMTIISTELDMETIFSPLHREGRLLALGDAFLDKVDSESCTFIWGENKPCRYMENSTKRKYSWAKPQKSSVLYHLQTRGSVIYADSQTLNRLKKESPYHNLGLNIFI